ncbi:MAG: tRNA (adenosine(37)-N6)-threonylcarbamoyltransferase complex dimerization subunit type 1 TsaB [Caulobacteraceae bacterium]
MKLLALDTALDACSVAVLDGAAVLAACSEPMQRGHQERLAPMTAEAMTAAGVAFADLGRIAIAVGPGSFTGVRVGLAFAKAMALALDLPCIGIGTLEVLAASAPEEAPGLVAAVIDARRGQVYVQPFRDGLALDPPAALDLETAAARLEALGWRDGGALIGSGAALIGETLPGVRILAGSMGDPVVLGRLALDRPIPERRPQPLYLRAPDARTIAERAAAAS